MKLKYRYINFVEGLSGEWTIWNNRSDDFLGVVSFYKQFKKWELSLENNVGFTKECLLDVIDFIKQLESQNNYNGKLTRKKLRTTERAKRSSPSYLV